MNTSAVTFAGRDKRGVARSGVIGVDVSDFVYRCFRAGWKQLVVQQGGAVLGAIEATPTRHWWAEGHQEPVEGS